MGKTRVSDDDVSGLAVEQFRLVLSKISTLVEDLLGSVTSSDTSADDLAAAQIWDKVVELEELIEDLELIAAGNFSQEPLDDMDEYRESVSAYRQMLYGE